MANFVPRGMAWGYVKQALSLTPSLPLGNHQPRIPLFSMALWASRRGLQRYRCSRRQSEERKFTPLPSVFANSANRRHVAQLAETEEPSSERAGYFSPTLLSLTATSVRRSVSLSR